MINITFDTLDDMLTFANRLAGLGQSGSTPLQENHVVASISPAPQIPVTPVAQIPIQQAPTTTAPVQTQAAPVAPTQTPTPAVTTVPPTTVQTSAPSYTMDDLTRAAVMLMDTGRQPDLLNLLAQFGVDSLPALPQEQYGAFATALRGLGAQI